MESFAFGFHSSEKDAGNMDKDERSKQRNGAQPLTQNQVVTRGWLKSEKLRC